MKCLESFIGVLERVDGGTAHVTLTSEATGEVLWGEYPAAEMARLGVREGRRFRCRTVEVDTATVRIEIEPIPDVEISPERDREIEQLLGRIER